MIWKVADLARHPGDERCHEEESDDEGLAAEAEPVERVSRHRPIRIVPASEMTRTIVVLMNPCTMPPRSNAIA